MRDKILVGCILVAFVAIIIRLFYWQLIKGPSLAEAASDQYFVKVTLPPLRGEIRAADNDVLVGNSPAYSVIAQPQKIADKLIFSELVGKRLEKDAHEILAQISQEGRLWVPLKDKLDERVYKELTDLHLEGLTFEKEGKRFYSESSMAAQLLGFVANDENGEDTGYFGLEGYYDRALRGKSGALIQEKDARGAPIMLGSNKRIPSQDGQRLTLYIDRSVQYIVEKNLKTALSQYGAKSGLVVVMDPKSGGILASASFPNYDPGHFNEYSNDLYVNPLISEIYEPGSTFKSLVMAAAINEKAVLPDTTYEEKGPEVIGEYAIKTWNDKYSGTITMTQVLEKSSNPGMVFVGRKLGGEKLHSYLEAYGFGEKTNVDLQGEEAAPLRASNSWGQIDYATATFGQGIAVTPIQMIRAVGVLANNGKLLEPHVVKQLEDDTGTLVNREVKEVRSVISSISAKTITGMLVSAVEHGDAKWARPKGYTIAGKTGTAQIAISGHYDEKKTNASFVGYGPVADPRFVMLVLLNEPQSSQWGSETAAPLFFKIAKELFTYYGIAPQ